MQEGPPLATLIEAPMELEESSAMLVQKDGAKVKDDAMVE